MEQLFKRTPQSAIDKTKNITFPIALFGLGLLYANSVKAENFTRVSELSRQNINQPAIKAISETFECYAEIDKQELEKKLTEKGLNEDQIVEVIKKLSDNHICLIAAQPGNKIIPPLLPRGQAFPVGITPAVPGNGFYLEGFTNSNGFREYSGIISFTQDVGGVPLRVSLGVDHQSNSNMSSTAAGLQLGTIFKIGDVVLIPTATFNQYVEKNTLSPEFGTIFVLPLGKNDQLGIFGSFKTNPVDGQPSSFGGAFYRREF